MATEAKNHPEEYHVLAICELPKGGTDKPAELILALIPGGNSPFVTWLRVYNEDGTHFTVAGDYFQTIGVAVSGYTERGKRLGGGD